MLSRVLSETDVLVEVPFILFLKNLRSTWCLVRISISFLSFTTVTSSQQNSKCYFKRRVNKALHFEVVSFNDFLLSHLLTESSMFLPEQIKELELRVQVLWLGPNLSSFVKSLVSKYELRSGNRRRAVMFFSWKPTILTMEFSSISISFPSCDLDQFCTYESRSLEKVVSSKLKEGAKTAYEVSKGQKT